MDENIYTKKLIQINILKLSKCWINNQTKRRKGKTINIDFTFFYLFNAVKIGV